MFLYDLICHISALLPSFHKTAEHISFDRPVSGVWMEQVRRGGGDHPKHLDAPLDFHAAQ